MKKITKRNFNEEQSTEAIRINKYLSEAGVCSRREADSFIEQGKVQIDGATATMGSKVLPGQLVTFNGKDIEREEKQVLIAFNKPQGIVCTTDRREPDNIIDFIQYGSRIYPIGRLDKDSEGLILLTNNGEIVNKILRAGNNHEKEYIVRVNQMMTAEFLKGMASGVPILDTVTKPCEIEALDKTTFRIILKQGLNRQIRRMCEYFGYRVVNLQRVRVMNVNLGRLKLGGYRNLTDYELEELKSLIQESSNAPRDNEIDEEMLDFRTSDNKSNKSLYKSSRSTSKVSGKTLSKAKNFKVNDKKNSNKTNSNKTNSNKTNSNKSSSYKSGSYKTNDDKTFSKKLSDDKSFSKKANDDKSYSNKFNSKSNNKEDSNRNVRIEKQSQSISTSNKFKDYGDSDRTKKHGRFNSTEKSENYRKSNSLSKSSDAGKMSDTGKTHSDNKSNNFSKSNGFGKSNDNRKSNSVGKSYSTGKTYNSEKREGMDKTRNGRNQGSIKEIHNGSKKATNQRTNRTFK